jgi:hypothetical protein
VARTVVWLLARDRRRDTVFATFEKDGQPVWTNDPDNATSYKDQESALQVRGVNRDGRLDWHRRLAETYLVQHWKGSTRIRRGGWSDAEVDRLRALSKSLSADIIAERLGRTRGAVEMKRRRLGLSKKFSVHPWTPDQIELVRKHKWGASRKLLADKLGLDIGRVGSMIAIVRRKRNGITRNSLMDASTIGV